MQFHSNITYSFHNHTIFNLHRLIVNLDSYGLDWYVPEVFGLERTDSVTSEEIDLEQLVSLSDLEYQEVIGSNWYMKFVTVTMLEFLLSNCFICFVLFNLLLAFHRHCLAVYGLAFWTVTFGPNLLFQISYKQPCQKDIHKPLLSKPLSIFLDSDLFSKLLYVLSALGRYCIHVWIDILFQFSGINQRKKYHLLHSFHAPGSND